MPQAKLKKAVSCLVEQQLSPSFDDEPRKVQFCMPLACRHAKTESLTSAPDIGQGTLAAGPSRTFAQWAVHLLPHGGCQTALM